LGVGSMVSFPLFVKDDTLGALNLFSRVAGAFDDESGQVGLLFTSQAAVALAGMHEFDHPGPAVDSRYR
ncbi:MAG: hypothetical protein ACRYG2_13605, partial [Janthinobacterium lividum]